MLLSGGGAINLDDIATLQGAYGTFPPASEVSAPIDLTVLDTIDLGLGVQLFGGSDVLTLGAVGQYQRSDATGSYAASGAIGADGAITAGGGAPTTLDLSPVLGAVGAGTLISDLSVELGAVAASAQATRTVGAPTLTSDYQIAGGVVTLTSPTLAGAIGAVDADLTTLTGTVNALGADGGTIDTTVGGLLGGIDAILEDVLLGLVDLDDPTVTTTLAVDLGAALDTAAGTPFVSGPVTVDLTDGTVLIDLAQLHDLNNLAPNTELIASPAVNAQITAAISDILTAQLPNRVGAALDQVLNTTDLTITIDAGVDVLGLPAGDLVVTIDGTLGGLLGTPGSTPLTTSLAGTNVLGLDLDEVLTPITMYVAGTILPAVGDVVEGVLSTDAVETAVTDALTGTVTALAPLADLIAAVVSVTGNVQETPGDFRNANGYDADSFTQRAVTIEVAPAISAIVLNLASATVRALPLAAPADLAIDPVRGPVTGGTEVTITGTNLADVSGITFGGIPSGPLTFNTNGSITTTTPAQAEPGVVPVAVTNPDGTNATLTFEYFNVASVDSIDPDSGSTLGGDEITIIGECFTGATGVTFGGVAGTDFEVVSDTEIAVTTPAGTPGLVDVVVLNPTECGDATVDDGFTYVTPGAPTLTDIDPDRGPETGDTTVTITGTDFDGTTSVTFGGAPATSFIIDSDTQITAVTPAHAPGVVDVVVTNGTGASAALDFEYFDVADIDGVDPGIGPEDGGNTVVITGDCFTGATGVTFGGTPATTFTVDSDTQITATVPDGTGVVDVVVEGLGDCGTATDEDGFEYVPAPVVTDLDPTSGPETGDTDVVITGSGFDDATGVLFDDTAGVEFDVVSDTEIVVTTPAHAPGVVTVTVQHPGGDVDAGDFEFLNVPSVTSLTPGTGPDDGGTVVTVIGEGFTGATGVTFDGLPGTTFTVVSDTEIRVTTPPHAPATVDVVVEHPVADSEAVPFVYVEGTVIDTITPPGGPEDGGTEVTITGACFTGATGVFFGTTPATSFEVVSDTEIVAFAPAGTGVVDVTVVGAAACGTETVPDGYEYTDDPVIGSIEPTRGPETGGTVVTIIGSNLGGATSVTFDGIPGAGLTVVSDTELTVTTPAGTPGDATVIVTSPDGTSNPGVFTYYAVTTIVDGNPDAGPIDGGTTVSLIGHCFTGATAVLFGGVPATSFTIASDTVIRAVAPAGRAAGTVDITVVGAGDCGTGVLADGFTYQAGGALAATGGTKADLSLATMGGIMLLLGAGAVLIRRRRLS